ncbi:hypothetical protein LXT21_04930 [Myxococcus sp. K38C18041901]|uniref:hypothetical protein n=1 Tax=Myxococcus guangdongensis TaxID=2906760 RepID=UPI0020A7ABF2|nr:hypothetical protein [Myxococcus guangdongensis]MCP3058115.1 hypothetical protein [Myxococcus guangdongensis]
MKRSVSMSAAIFGTIIGLVVPVSSAQAADCGGNLIFRKAAFAGGTVVGELVVYYNPSNGNNCARFNRLGPAYGVMTYTEVQLTKCSTVNPGSGCGAALAIIVDADQYAYYAGPVRVNSPRNCVTAEGRINWNGNQHIVSTGGVIGC